MAVRVPYFENTTDCYQEGPFVMVNAGGWRIEVEYEGAKCPALPDLSIYGFLKEKGLPFDKTNDTALMECVIDYLNKIVKEGGIVKEGIAWVWPPHKLNVELEAYQKRRLDTRLEDGCVSLKEG